MGSTAMQFANKPSFAVISYGVLTSKCVPHESSLGVNWETFGDLS
jgi:hypothetical protein